MATRGPCAARAARRSTSRSTHAPSAPCSGQSRSQGPIFRRQDGRRLRTGSPAPRVPYNRQAVYRLLAELAQQAGLIGEGDDQVDGLHPHRLRHTFVTMLLDRGVSLAAVQDAARHASSDTTRRYDRSRTGWREHPTHHLDF